MGDSMLPVATGYNSGGVRPDQLNVRSLSSSGIDANGTVIDTSLVQTRINPVVQFNVVNNGSQTEKLRIGSHLAFPDAYALYDGVTPGAADSADIQDDLGVGCLSVQGFSKIAIHKPVVFTKMKMFSTNPLQLAQQLKYMALQYDGTIDVIKQNTAWEAKRSDNRVDLVEVTGTWLLDSTQFLEIPVLAGADLQILFEIVVSGSAAIMKVVNQGI